MFFFGSGGSGVQQNRPLLEFATISHSLWDMNSGRGICNFDFPCIDSMIEKNAYTFYILAKRLVHLNVICHSSDTIFATKPISL